MWFPVPLLTSGHVCSGLNLAFEECACDVLQEGVCMRSVKKLERQR